MFTYLEGTLDIHMFVELSVKNESVFCVGYCHFHTLMSWYQMLLITSVQYLLQDDPVLLQLFNI